MYLYNFLIVHPLSPHPQNSTCMVFKLETYPNQRRRHIGALFTKIAKCHNAVGHVGAPVHVPLVQL
jgi:hypothetical protein